MKIDGFLQTILASELQQARQHCNQNPLEVFGFLAFGLYLLNLAMGMGRKKRSAGDSCGHNFDPASNPELVEAVMAFTAMFRGYLSIGSEDEGI